MQTQAAAGSYTVSPELLAREEFQAACRAREFAELFRLMRKYDGASQDRIASPGDGLTQSRVSRIMRGSDHIASLELIQRISDALHIPGAYFGLASRPWEADTAPSSHPSGTGPVNAPVTSGNPVSQTRRVVDAVVQRRLTIDIEIDSAGWARLPYEHDLHNATTTPFTRLSRELWFEHTNGSLDLQAVSPPDRSIIIQRVHDTQLNAKFACQILPALQPGESTSVGYTCTGGRFVYDHYWRQSVTHPTNELIIRLRHHGIDTVTRCSALEERPDGSELSAAESLILHRDSDGIIIELTRRNLLPNQSVTLRWDRAHADA
jgi:transcriptional regulator with XRE-family HTH domain